ncbi:hypothetical protein [Coleofasciculus sp. H7-2]|uniref:hypothetical protein n=1 Tax=Coleofasciculus sp. H7-2 TaxID=3351545 RepID=UPI00366DF69C
MNQGINRLQKICLRLATVVLAAIAFLVIPAFSYSPTFQAQAQTLIADNADFNRTSSDRIKKAIDMAEDHVGDRDGIGNTGLKNIKKLGENIPETADVIRSQRFDNDQPGDVGDPSVVQDKNNQGVAKTKNRAAR